MADCPNSKSVYRQLADVYDRKLAVAWKLGGDANSTTPFPATMHIDDIRAYQNSTWNPSTPVTTPTPNPNPVTTGSGSDTLVLSISEDAYANGDGTSDANGDAAFTVSVDGKQLAGTFFATALAFGGRQPELHLQG